MVLSSDRSEIAFFDVETTVPKRTGQGFAILEFGAILVCPRKLIELVNYSTLVQPPNLSHISNLSVRCNGITKEAVVSAPTFSDIADKVYEILHGRIWAGHNILRFDCPRIREAFAEINRPAPEPKGTIDSLVLLTQRFGRRAGDMKMATLATYFGIGQQTHRSLDDVRMNLEVLKYCATVLFLESSLPDIFTENSWVSPNTTRSRPNGKSSPEGNADKPSSSRKFRNDVLQSIDDSKEESHPILSFVTPVRNVRNHGVSDPVEPNSAMPDAFDNMERDILFSLNSMEEEESSSAQELSPSTESEASSNGTNFLSLDEISEAFISVNPAPFYRGTQKIQILHKDVPLEVFCKRLKVRFGAINSKYPSIDGRPRLSFVVDASPSLCRILDIIDNHAQKFSMDFGSTSDWRPVVARKPGFYPTLRLNLPTIADGDMVRWATEIYHKESSAPQRLIFSRFDASELESLLSPGKFVDAYFSLDTYDYQQKSGIRLVAKKLIIHQN